MWQILAFHGLHLPSLWLFLMMRTQHLTIMRLMAALRESHWSNQPSYEWEREDSASVQLQLLSAWQEMGGTSITTKIMAVWWMVRPQILFYMCLIHVGVWISGGIRPLWRDKRWTIFNRGVLIVTIIHHILQTLMEMAWCIVIIMGWWIITTLLYKIFVKL